MPDSSKSAADQKEKTKEKMVIWPTLDDTLSLRDCAKRISASRPGNSQILEPGLLLQELRIGALSAGFHLSVDPLIWIEIPAQYWVSITNDKFDSIRRKSGSKTKTGNFTVTLSTFLDQYIEARLLNLRVPSGPVDKKWLFGLTDEFYRKADESFDVAISGASWRQFELSNNIQQRSLSPAPSEANLSATRAEHKGKQGRKPLESWKELYECLAMFLIQKVSDKVTADAIARAVFEKLDKVYPEKMRDFPRESSFEKAILKIRAKAQEIY